MLVATVFSKALSFMVVKTRDCVVKNYLSSPHAFNLDKSKIITFPNDKF